MENWLAYTIYTLAALSILLAVGGLKAYSDTKDTGLLLSSLVSIALSCLAIFYVHWAPLVIGFVLNIAISRLFPKYAHTSVSVPSPDTQRSEEKERKPGESQFEACVEQHLQDVTAPTELMLIRPNEYLPGLLSEILVPTSFLLEKMEFNKQRTLGGPFIDRVAREVLYRWFSMPQEARSDDAHRLIPDQLSSALSMHLSSIFHHAKLHVFCGKCDRWYPEVINLTARYGSSQIQAQGQERYACPNRHLVYERDYKVRFVR